MLVEQGADPMTSRFLTISAALVLLGSAPAAAQSNGWLGAPPAYAGDDWRAPYQDARRAGYDNGYRDGVKRGEQAARDRKAFNAQLERDYRDATNGYNRSYGDRERYRDDYRGGFAQGYRDGYYRRDSRDSRDQYGRYPGYGNNGRYGNGNGNQGNGNRYGYGRNNAGYGAFQNGASDGYRKGLEDIEKRRYPDVSRHSWYRNGDHDYDRAYGSKDAYRIEYRRGFQEGYNRAFRSR
jgi:hypothetical protein